MPATARDLMKSLIQVYPVKEQPASPNRDWLNMLIKKNDILLEFDMYNQAELNDMLIALMPDVDFVTEFATSFGTQNVIETVNGNKVSSVSYYLKTGVLFGVYLRTRPKYQLEEKITLNKAGYHFTTDPLEGSKHPGNEIARITIKKFLFDLYGCRTVN